jgi:DNA-binding NtrC family response regulator
MSDIEEMMKTLTATQARTVTHKRAALEIVSGPDAGKRHEFEDRVRVGARQLADWVIQDPKVSGLHCEIVAGTQITIRDLGSKNGTFLGKYRVVEAAVPPGEVITIGSTALRVVPLGDRALPLPEDNHFHGIVGRSAVMRSLIEQIQALATTNANVLIQGETGTGKERVAEALHLSGLRAEGPLEIVDCAALLSTVAPSELFGHERGAFTGADTRSIGAFERANGGTIFLDEIGELPLDLQPTLLRGLESRTIRRVGGAKSIQIDIRVIAATNRDLAIEANRGRFREDLYYRLSGVKLTVPPLRSRLDDIPLLAVHLLEEMGVEPSTILTAEALSALAQHDWPGNVRELRNTLQRAALTATAPAPESPEALHREAGEPDLTKSLPQFRQQVTEQAERAYLSALFRECRGNISQVARRAGVDRMTIYRTMQRLRLHEPSSS